MEAVIRVIMNKDSQLKNSPLSYYHIIKNVLKNKGLLEKLLEIFKYSWTKINLIEGMFLLNLKITIILSDN